MNPIIQMWQREITQHPLMFFDQNNPDEDSIRGMFKKMKPICKYHFDNIDLMWSNIYGDLFAIHVHFSDNKRTNIKSWEISFWDTKGQTSIGHIFQPCIDENKDVLSDDNYNILTSLTEQYSHGLYHCSHCHKELKKSEIAGRYFAGIYCTECWEREYKAIEAKETYE